jgi:hypothetical protein
MWRPVPDHSSYGQLAALGAGGHLSLQENEEFRLHLVACSQCRLEAVAYRDIVTEGLPAVFAAAFAWKERATARPDPGARARFLARARSEGVRFSPEVTGRASPGDVRSDARPPG